MAKEYIERGAVAKMLENAQMITDGEYCGYCTEDVCLDNIPTADVVSKEQYDDLYSKYCNLAKILNDKLPPIVEMVNNADVVEVTYCRDCTHCDPENKHCDHPMGTSLPVPRKDTDFCSYGEKKDK